MTSERDNCGLSSILPISCRERAEAFARSLQSRLSTLGGHETPNNERSWLGPHERPVTLSQPLQTSGSTDRFYDLEHELDSPLSPQDELEQKDFAVLLNKDNLTNGFISDNCHCPKFEETENKRQPPPFFVAKANGLTKCTSNESVDSEIFYDIDDDPPNLLGYHTNGLKNSESSKSVNSELNSQGTSSSNQSEAYCTSLDCTPQPSLSDDLSTLSIQKLSDSSSASDLNGLSERSSSAESNSDDSRRVNGHDEENSLKLNGYIHLNGCREHINIEDSVSLRNEFEHDQTTREDRNTEEICIKCRINNDDNPEPNSLEDDNGCSNNENNVRKRLDFLKNEAIGSYNGGEINTKNEPELVKIGERLELSNGDYKEHISHKNETYCELKVGNNDEGEEILEILVAEHIKQSTDETDLRVIENDSDECIKNDSVVNRLNIDIKVDEGCDTKEQANDTQTIKTANDNEFDDADDDDDESPILRIRRCSSLKTGKTPPGTPGTPGRKKIVRFADVLGLDLADVRTFLDEIPKVPKSAYDDLSDVDITDSSDSSDLLILGGNKYHGIKTDRILVPMFEQPGVLPNFLDLVRDFQVCLENAFVDDPVLFSIRGFVRVRNLDFHKSVHIRYSLDSWITFSDVQGTYCSNSCDGFSDKFSFIIYANTLQVGQRIEFACRFQCKGFQYWDNNRGKNYIFQCLPAATGPSVSWPQTTAARASLNTHDDWGASFY